MCASARASRWAVEHARPDLGLDDVEDLGDDAAGAAHPLDLGARLAGDHRQTRVRVGGAIAMQRPR